jgi:hypothetical protein
LVADLQIEMYDINGGRSLVPITAEPGLDAGVVKKSAVFQVILDNI